MLKLLLIVFLALNLNGISCLKCHRFDATAKHVFATKTNYNRSLSYFKSPNLDDLNLDKLVPDTCKLDKLFLLSRHSTRNPSKGRMKQFLKMYPKLKESLLKEFDKDEERSNCEYYLYYHLTKNVLRYTMEEEGLMVKIGEEITKEIGRFVSYNDHKWVNG